MRRSQGDQTESTAPEPVPGDPQPTHAVCIPAPQALAAEAERLVLRYAKEVVEALGFCPWAAQARRAGQVRVEVLLGTAPSPDDIARVMARLARRTHIIIGLVVMPEVRHGAVGFRRLVGRVRERTGQLYPPGQAPWAVVDFHPQGALDMTSSDRAAAFIRRTPDPTLQLVRRHVLSELRVSRGEGTRFVDPSRFDLQHVTSETAPVSLRARIAVNNWHTLQRLGPEVRRRLVAIHQDRHRSYARLGLAPVPWAAEWG